MDAVWRMGGYPSGPRQRNWGSSGDASVSRDGDANACPISGPTRHARVVPSSRVGKKNRLSIPFVRETHHRSEFKCFTGVVTFYGNRSGRHFSNSGELVAP